MAEDDVELVRLFCRRQREWLDVELAADNAEHEQQEGGLSSSEEGRAQGLHRLQVEDVSVGLYGRTVLRFVPMTVTASSTTSNDCTAKPSSAAAATSTLPLLPAHRFTTGDEVEIRGGNSSSGGSSRKAGGGGGVGVKGVICEVADSFLSVALGGSGGGSPNNKGDNNSGTDYFHEDHLSSPVSILSRGSLEVHRKLVAALDELERGGLDGHRHSRVVRALFDPASILLPDLTMSPRDEPSPSLPVSAFNANLDESQLRAVAACLDAHHTPLSCVWGPPGTGKTTTVVEVIRQAVQKGWRVLVTAPSNVAVDNVLSNLMTKSTAASTPAPSNKSNSRIGARNCRKAGGGGAAAAAAPSPSHRLRVVRLGHPARMQSEILCYSLDSLVQSAEGTAIVADVRAELQTFLRVLNSSSRNRGKDRTVARKEISTLRKEIRTREERVVDELLGSAQVVLATCVGAANRLLKDAAFDLVIIDEAAQALEAACWIPALLCRTKLVLAGDHCQLPPTVKAAAVQRELGYTMFERIMDQGPALSRMLQVQYRMHQTIADWSSRAMYGGRLESHETVRNRTLAQLVRSKTADASSKFLNGDSECDDTDPDSGDDGTLLTTPFLLIDTAYCDMHELVNPAGSRFNLGEAEIVARHVTRLIDLGLGQEQIAVITPYNGQVETLRNLLGADYPRLDIKSVDGFQGGEREAIVISLVRSSPRSGKDGIGFLSDARRLNVAVTRSKRHCCVICDSETVKQNAFIRSLLDWIVDHGRCESALDYIDGIHEGGSTHQPQRSFPRGQGKGRREPSPDPEEIARRQKLLIERIRDFAVAGKPGHSMKLSSNLSRFDRKVVHEECEKLGIGHASEGIEGVDRCITLLIPKNADAIPDTASVHSQQHLSEMTVTRAEEIQTLEPAAENDPDRGEIVASEEWFQLLNEGSLEESEEETEKVASETDIVELPCLEKPKDGTCSLENTNLLADLARERTERLREGKMSSIAPKPAQRPKKQGRQKLWRNKKAALATGRKFDEGMEDLDDMAFLDRQIEQIQTAHGRKLEGKGGYRTIINGILTPVPKAAGPRKSNPKASAALQAKLRSAQDDRKAKQTKKK
jgi:ATP-dependent RNA/DNA helicase IGHMBP2